MKDLYNWGNYSVTANFVSGILWIPYTLFLVYLFYEHHKREKFPQNLIMLLLAVGAAFRTVWFLGCRLYQTTIAFLVINRIAILLQFSALAVLILMWMRALKITQIAYTKQPSSLLMPSASFAGNRAPKDRDQSTQSPGALTQSPSRQSNSSSLQRQTTLTQASRQALMFKQVEAQFQRLVWYVGVFVAIVWLSILLSLLGDTDYHRSSSSQYFQANIIMISTLCLCEAFFTLIVGFRTALALQKELAPVFVSSSATQAPGAGSKHSHLTAATPSGLLARSGNYGPSSSIAGRGLKTTGSNGDLVALGGGAHDERLLSQGSDAGHERCWQRALCCGVRGGGKSCCAALLDCCGFRAFLSLYRLFFTRSQSALGLQLQRDVLRSLLTVSLIVFVFFFLRAFGFLFRFIDTSKSNDAANDAVGEVWYPLLFYQLPELVPTLAIAAGISPPNGVLKRLLAGAWALGCCASGGASAYASSDFASGASASTRRTRASQRSQRRQQTSVGSSASYLSSLTGGTSLHSGASDAQPPALTLPVGAAAASVAGSKLAPIAEHEPPSSPQGSSVATSSLATSQQSATSLERHVGGSLTQHLQLPLHLQQQLQIAQLQHQHQQLLQYQQNPLIPSQAAGRVDSPPPPARALSSAARDSDASLLLGRLSELQTEPRHSDATAAPGGVQVQRSQSSSATQSVDSHRPKASFSIASSPVNGGLAYPLRAGGASQREAVLVDDVLDGSEEGADAFDERALPRSAPSQPQTPVVWSPLTGTSLASSAGPLVGSQSSSLPQSLPSSARSQSSSRHLRGALPPLHAQSQSSSQQRAGLISLLFGRRGGGASAPSQRAPRSVDEDFDDERQQSADYAELLYRLNSYVPERLHSADALYTNMDAARLQPDAVGAAALVAAGLGAHEDAPPVVSASEEGEHALAAYLAPKSRWTRGPDAGDDDAGDDVEQGRPSDGDGSAQSGGSGSGKRRQSALSKSWLHKVMG